MEWIFAYNKADKTLNLYNILFCLERPVCFSVKYAFCLLFIVINQISAQLIPEGRGGCACAIIRKDYSHSFTVLQKKKEKKSQINEQTGFI